MQANESTGDWLFLDKPKPEPKAEARERASMIANLIQSLNDAPDVIAQRKSDIAGLRYYIRKAKKATLSPNDHDGMARMYGCMGELAELTERDCKQVRDNPKVWKKLPKGYPSARASGLYCASLHPKEIAVLEEAVTECENEIWRVRKEVPVWERELKKLREVGPLPVPVAARYNLTTDGLPKDNFYRTRTI